ncbi:unnamed protein product [Kuraishia capsulata CBS 1993]|uniref:glucan endo-1,3-beta-D-glucosidase n=1 Tax=Kuraishia capsulata CBS 1993 TaxID=1382522 RepID=W6MVR8_9ASCO|nr:uncharacterized protein KUCA_T00002417001 [Kuraishia capsulata CBS 1993]CDK26445.1 unnamed protein product [Kuraishia capsulata CBS 1993]
MKVTGLLFTAVLLGGTNAAKTITRTVKVYETKVENIQCGTIPSSSLDVWSDESTSTEQLLTRVSATLPSYDLNPAEAISYGSFSENPTVALVTPITTGGTTLVLVGSVDNSGLSATISSSSDGAKLPTTQSNPMYTSSLPSSSLSVTIDINTLTEDVTISESSFVASFTDDPDPTNLPVYTLDDDDNSSDYSDFETETATGVSSIQTYPVSSSVGSDGYYNASSAASSASSVASRRHGNLVTESSSSSAVSTSLDAAATTKTSTINLFNAVATTSPAKMFKSGKLAVSVARGVKNYDVPYQTNKFYTNLMLDDQDDSVWTYPYAFFYSKTYKGLAISYRTKSEWYFDSSTTPPSYFYGPIDVASIAFSASSFTSSNIRIGVNDMYQLSANAKLYEHGKSTEYIEVPLVEGMGFATAIYHGSLKPVLTTGVYFSKLISVTSKSVPSGVLKYEATLNDNSKWLIYVTVPDKYKTSSFNLKLSGNSKIVGNKAISGLIIQIAVEPSSKLQVYYDEAAGMYPVSAAVSGTFVTSTDIATWKITYTTKGKSSSGKTMLFALIHHVNSMASVTKSAATGITLYSVSKGALYGFLANELVMQENLKTVSKIGFLPWSSSMTKSLSYTSAQLKKIAKAANSELSVDIPTAANTDSTYYAGKILDKYAYILLVLETIVKDKALTKSTLAEMKKAFAVFTKNKQYYPLMYETKFKGVTSTASTTSGDSGADFGSSYYNDHHFHYGYFVHAAAAVGYVDARLGGTWAKDNKDWVNALIRDVANPSSKDTYFPVSRMFDWYQGHSWAAGLFTSGDGRNEESSSEDYNFAYGMKLWGSVTGDKSMENRGNLMLAIMKRSFNEYFLYWDNNSVEPKSYIPNKVSGILYENKIAYSTFFGTNTEYIHGIHMLPITPVSSLIRGWKYTKQEWKEKLASIIKKLTGGYAGILRLNQALFDPSSSYSFFSSSSFSSDDLDDGQSLTWALAFSAGLMNST